jgi:hypothetical protein
VWWLLMSDVACVSGLPIISLTFSWCIFFDA